MSSVVSGAVAAGSHIGRYFSVVAMVPSIGAVSWLALLAAGDAWSGSFDPGKAIEAAGRWGIGDVAVLVAAALLAGVLINPFQFAVTQVLEGYWGAGRLGLALSTSRINMYRRRLRRTADRSAAAQKRWIEQAIATLPAQLRPPETDRKARRKLATVVMNGAAGDELLNLHLIAIEAVRLESNFPPAPRRILPTRLGNTLRAAEDRVGQQYGLSAIAVAGHLSLLAESPRSAYVRDTRQTMDLALRCCMMALLVTPVTAVLLASDGLWVLTTAVPYGIAYLAYLGAVSAAKAYGNAVRFQIDLDRFALYDALRMPKPKTLAEEQEQNRRLLAVLRGGAAERLAYAESPAGDAPADTATTPQTQQSP